MTEKCNKCAETTYDRGYKSGFNRGVELRNAKLKEAMEKIKKEICYFCNIQYGGIHAGTVDFILDIISKHTEGLV